MPQPKRTETSVACSTPLLPRLQSVISPAAPSKLAPPGGGSLNEQGGQGGPAKCSGQILNSFLIPTQSFRKSLSAFKIHARLTVTSHPQAASISPRVVAASPRVLAPAPAAASVCSPPGSQAALLKLGLNRAVSSKPSKDSLFHLQSSPAVGPQAFHDLQPTPSSSSYLASCSSPLSLFVQAHSHLRGLTCAVPSGAIPFPLVSTWIPHSSGQLRCHPHMSLPSPLYLKLQPILVRLFLWGTDPQSSRIRQESKGPDGPSPSEHPQQPSLFHHLLQLS